LRKRDEPTRLLLLLNGAQLSELELRDDLYDDFCLTPFHPVEVEARLRHLLFQGFAQVKNETVEYSGLALNVETYQASIEGRPLDLTYMEYELLKFLAQNPGKVFPRDPALPGVGL
jgi:DNA-binding response OmpR family regulator